MNWIILKKSDIFFHKDKIVQNFMIEKITYATDKQLFEIEEKMSEIFDNTVYYSNIENLWCFFISFTCSIDPELFNDKLDEIVDFFNNLN